MSVLVLPHSIDDRGRVTAAAIRSESNFESEFFGGNDVKRSGAERTVWVRAMADSGSGLNDLFLFRVVQVNPVSEDRFVGKQS